MDRSFNNNEGKPLLSCKNVTVGYDEIRLCSGISFTVHEGEYVCVVGHSGVGKTTFAKTLLGDVKPVEGEVELYGLTRGEIGFVPQSEEIHGSSTVRDVVLSGCIVGMHGFFISKKEKEAAREAMELLGVAEFAKKRFSELSGGQKQKVLLARAMCGNKRLLILDEPMKGLDAAAKDEVFSLIASLNRDRNCAVVIIDSDALDGTILHLSDTQLYCGPVDRYINSFPGRFYFAGRII